VLKIPTKWWGERQSGTKRDKSKCCTVAAIYGENAHFTIA